ncbi:MAG: PrsW family intramembrane metalloprotease [Firmicutes bacterium]|nr:PrsW family intramembrane metalloprotease [Bacillota bacterium]
MLQVALASLLPGLFWLWYFNRYDVVEQEPTSQLGKCLFFGGIAVLLALAWESPFAGLLQTTHSLLTQLMLSFFVVGLGEETFKFLATYLAVAQSPEFNEPMDGIIYSIAVAIGFAVIENILYISAFGLTIAPLRGTIATLAHIAFSGLAGYYLGLAKLSSRPSSELTKGVALAAFLHGLYDFLLISRLAPPLILVLFVLTLHYWLLTRIKLAVASSPLR